MYNIIITEPSGNLRKLGRESLAGNWQGAIIAMLIYQICLTLPALILDQVFGKTLAELYGTVYYDSSSSFGSAFVAGVSSSAEKVSTLSGVYMLLVCGAFSFGISLFFLNLFRRKQTDAAQVFSGFEYYVKTLGLYVVMSVFIFLWSLLFIIPGIIAAIRYSQAFFILADDPGKGVMQCMSESKLLMRGNKGKYFCMALSFIGWLLLTGICIGIVSVLLETIITSGTVMVIVDWILGLAVCWVIAYMTATEAAFYEILTGRLRANTYKPIGMDGFEQ